MCLSALSPTSTHSFTYFLHFSGSGKTSLLNALAGTYLCLGYEGGIKGKAVVLMHAFSLEVEKEGYSGRKKEEEGGWEEGRGIQIKSGSLV